MTDIDKVRSVLLELPSTAYEVGIIVGVSSKCASSYLGALRNRGEAYVLTELPSGGTRTAQVYALTDHGKSVCAKRNIKPYVDPEEKFRRPMVRKARV